MVFSQGVSRVQNCKMTIKMFTVMLVTFVKKFIFKEIPQRKHVKMKSKVTLNDENMFYFIILFSSIFGRLVLIR